MRLTHSLTLLLHNVLLCAPFCSSVYISVHWIPQLPFDTHTVVPQRKVREDWKERPHAAAQKLSANLLAGYKAQEQAKQEKRLQYAQRGPSQRPSHSESEFDSDSSGALSDDIPDMRNGAVNSVPAVITSHPDEDFVMALPHCLPMFLGFQISLGSNDFCFCPCGKRMYTWRVQFGLNWTIGEEGPCTAGRNRTDQRKSPRALLDHAKAMWNEHGDRYHHYVYEYLMDVFDNYWPSGIGHKALYDYNTEDWKRAERAELLSLDK
jgi:hypothetical protein